MDRVISVPDNGLKLSETTIFCNFCQMVGCNWANVTQKQINSEH